MHIKCMNITTINEKKRGHEFEGEQRGTCGNCFTGGRIINTGRMSYRHPVFFTRRKKKKKI